MPTWGELILELQGLTLEFGRQVSLAGGQVPPGTPTPHDTLRRKYLLALHQLTGRAVIVYETAFLEPRPLDPTLVGVHLGDIPGFMEACSNIEEDELDLFLHSPGGQAEAAESIVKYLRQRFRHIRAIVPHAAMSAATMLALSADEIVMGQHSQLGPIDPQFNLLTPEGPRGAPGQAILDQFEKAKEECKDPNNLVAWLPILRMYGPGLLSNIDHQHRLAQDLVATWLRDYMFRNDDDPSGLADKAAKWFADFKTFKSHGRPVHAADARAVGIKITDLEESSDLQDAVLSVHHACQLTLNMTPAAKIIENHHGRAFIKIAQVVGLQMRPAVAPFPVPAPTPGGP